MTTICAVHGTLDCTGAGVCRICRRVNELARNRPCQRAGITVEEYDAMVIAQRGLCYICGNPPKKNRLAIDHDHDTGRVRHLLCPPCNRYIGRGLATLERAVAYLQEEL